MDDVSPPKVSIIVATLNSERTIDDCLKSILELNYPEDFLEIVVVDGCSKDATVKIAQKYPVKVISAPLNAPAAYNYAMKMVSNDVLGFIDADAKVEKEWLNKLITYLDNPQVAGVSGGIETWNTENALARIIGYDLKNRYARLKKYVVRVATMNLLLKKSLIEEVGGFDENLPSQYDTDLGFRITSRGYKILFEPSATCYHFNRSTVSGYFRQQLQYGKNTTKLYLKHANLIKGDEITDFGMNIQPFLILAVIAFFLLGIPEALRQLWYASAFVLALIVVYYVISAVRLSIKFKDVTAMLLVVLYFVRAFAWFSGAAVTTVRFLVGGRR
ncbi:MAG: glycosyltransferase [Candidatus Bathyarchaeota archaeon]|nr:MAG: glycosyltransferase [Candidatus Bathyarchaeota archaeon]